MSVSKQESKGAEDVKQQVALEKRLRIYMTRNGSMEVSGATWTATVAATGIQRDDQRYVLSVTAGNVMRGMDMPAWMFEWRFGEGRLIPSEWPMDDINAAVWAAMVHRLGEWKDVDSVHVCA